MTDEHPTVTSESMTEKEWLILAGVSVLAVAVIAFLARDRSTPPSYQQSAPPVRDGGRTPGGLQTVPAVEPTPGYFLPEPEPLPAMSYPRDERFFRFEPDVTETAFLRQLVQNRVLEDPFASMLAVVPANLRDQVESMRVASLSGVPPGLTAADLQGVSVQGGVLNAVPSLPTIGRGYGGTIAPTLSPPGVYRSLRLPLG
jgi:hypothetical protein